MRACVRAWAAALKVRTGLTEEREKRTTHGPCGFDAGRPLLTHHLQAQQRRGPSVFRHRGARGAGAPRGPPRERSLTVRSHTFKVRSLSLSHTGEVSLRSFRYVSRRVAFGAFGTVFLERYATLCNSANAGQNAALLFTPCFTRETLFSTKCVANPLFSTLF